MPGQALFTAHMETNPWQSPLTPNYRCALPTAYYLLHFHKNTEVSLNLQISIWKKFPNVLQNKDRRFDPITKSLRFFFLADDHKLQFLSLASLQLLHPLRSFLRRTPCIPMLWLKSGSENIYATSIPLIPLRKLEIEYIFFDGEKKISANLQTNYSDFL